MAIANVAELVQSELDGFIRMSSWRKAPAQTTTAGIWFDLSMSPGNPTPNYYVGAPNTFTAMSQSVNGGLAHCLDPETRREYLRTFGVLSNSVAAAMPFLLLDYIGYYPFVDESVTDEQFLDNTVTLPRYTSGRGVQIMPVVVAGQSGGGLFKVSYTNQDGVSGRVTPDHRMTTQAVNGTILTSAGVVGDSRGLFMALQAGDTGVRRIDSVTFLTSDVGLVSFVLAAPVARANLRGVDAPQEIDYFQDFATAPEVQRGAYLNLVCLPNGNLGGAALHGYIKTVWS